MSGDVKDRYQAGKCIPAFPFHRMSLVTGMALRLPLERLVCIKAKVLYEVWLWNLQGRWLERFPAVKLWQEMKERNRGR